MAETADVVVVGGGVAGTSVAHALAARGARVVLLEQGALASGASGRSSALVRMHYTNEWDARLAWASFPVFRDWPERMGGQPVFTRTGSRVTGVETAGGPIDAGAVVLAAGAWSTRLARTAGVELPARVKGIDTALVRRPPELARPHATVIDNVLGTYFRPESGILTIVGVPCQAWDLDPDAVGTGLPPEAADEASRILTHRIPAMERATLARGFRAFDGYSADRHAILGGVPGLDGLYLATAFSGAGFKIAPAVGTCLTELILDGEARTVDIRPFGLHRFAEGRPLEGPWPYAPRRDHVAPRGVVV